MAILQERGCVNFAVLWQLTMNVCLQRKSAERRARIIVESVRNILLFVAVGGSFILTDNLLAPYIASVTCDLLFRVYESVKFEQVQHRELQHALSSLTLPMLGLHTEKQTTEKGGFVRPLFLSKFQEHETPHLAC